MCWIFSRICKLLLEIWCIGLGCNCCCSCQLVILQVSEIAFMFEKCSHNQKIIWSLRHLVFCWKCNGFGITDIKSETWQQSSNCENCNCELQRKAHKLYFTFLTEYKNKINPKICRTPRKMQRKLLPTLW